MFPPHSPHLRSRAGKNSSARPSWRSRRPLWTPSCTINRLVSSSAIGSIGHPATLPLYPAPVAPTLLPSATYPLDRVDGTTVTDFTAAEAADAADVVEARAPKPPPRPPDPTRHAWGRAPGPTTPPRTFLGSLRCRTGLPLPSLVPSLLRLIPQRRVVRPHPPPGMPGSPPRPFRGGAKRGRSGPAPKRGREERGLKNPAGSAPEGRSPTLVHLDLGRQDGGRRREGARRGTAGIHWGVLRTRTQSDGVACRPTIDLEKGIRERGRDRSTQETSPSSFRAPPL